ncbi:MAG: hybrid sensor histidine kinase/response regulator [Chloroflexi bacterium]|nr:hybrid sensor histidine kinase/response regulator [Chloroflexota bacterium]
MIYKNDEKKKILVVEDAQSLRKDILEMLSFEGFEVIGAENGKEGVEQAYKQLPNLIICDIMMPVMDGFQVLHELRKNPVMATVPFIFLTARTDRVDHRKGMNLGANDYLTKPFTVSELLATVHARLAQEAEWVSTTENRLDELRGNIIRSLPHELRTPLNVILGFSDLLIADCHSMDASRIEDMARHINDAGMRLYQLVENFLIYANLELAKADERRLDTLQNGYLANPAETVRTAARIKVHQLKRSDDLEMAVEDVAAVGVVEEYLKKIVEELVDNACKFSEEGHKVHVKAAAVDGRYVLAVRDEGRGMTPEQIRNVGAYMQFDRQLYEQQGNGLGLVISRRLAELHGGELVIESVLEQGTIVTVTLPIREKVTSAATPSQNGLS